jgi:hypothetical protein
MTKFPRLSPPENSATRARPATAAAVARRLAARPPRSSGFGRIGPGSGFVPLPHRPCSPSFLLAPSLLGMLASSLLARRLPPPSGRTVMASGA